MRASDKPSPKKQRRNLKTNVPARVRAGQREAAKAIQRAYANLNTSATEEKAVEGELGQLMPYVMDRAKKLYETACFNYEAGDFTSARAFAHAADDVARVIDIVSTAKTENTLDLQTPPTLSNDSQRPVPAKNKRPLHNSLAALDKYLFEVLKTEPVNEYLSEELAHAYELLSKASRQIERFEQ